MSGVVAFSPTQPAVASRGPKRHKTLRHLTRQTFTQTPVTMHLQERGPGDSTPYRKKILHARISWENKNCVRSSCQPAAPNGCKPYTCITCIENGPAGALQTSPLPSTTPAVVRRRQQRTTSRWTLDLPIVIYLATTNTRRSIIVPPSAHLVTSTSSFFIFITFFRQQPSVSPTPTPPPPMSPHSFPTADRNIRKTPRFKNLHPLLWMDVIHFASFCTCGAHSAACLPLFLASLELDNTRVEQQRQKSTYSQTHPTCMHTVRDNGGFQPKDLKITQTTRNESIPFTPSPFLARPIPRRVRSSCLLRHGLGSPP